MHDLTIISTIDALQLAVLEVADAAHAEGMEAGPQAPIVDHRVVAGAAKVPLFPCHQVPHLLHLGLQRKSCLVNTHILAGYGT